MLIQSFFLAAFVVGMLTSVSASAAKCVRLSVSEMTFSKETVTDAAREKLAEYATDTLKERGWSGKGKLRSGKEKILCQTYLDVGPLGLVHQCRLTATYCAGQRKKKSTASSAIGKVVRLRLRGSKFEVLGVLKKYDATAYIIAPPGSDDVTVPANRFDCIGKVCPKSASQIRRK